MKVLNSPFPCSISFSADTGVIPCATAHYQKRLSDLRGFYLDPDILERRIREENDPVCYENYAFNDSQAEGDIFFGTTIIYPGKVGSEYHLTRGHYHQKRDHAEIYQALSGRGLVLSEREDGTTCTAELEPGKVTYIPPFWAHRSSTPPPRVWSSFGPVRLTLATTTKASAAAGCARSSWSATACRASRTVPHAKPKEAACPRVTASWDKTARVWDAATGKPVGKPIFVPHACTITRSRDEEGAGHLRHRSSAARPLRHCVTAERERCQAKSKCKRLIKESFRFLLEREPNTSILRSFHITDISRYFPNTNVEIRRRLTRWASTRPAVPGIMTRTSFALTPLP